MRLTFAQFGDPWCFGIVLGDVSILHYVIVLVISIVQFKSRSVFIFATFLTDEFFYI